MAKAIVFHYSDEGKLPKLFDNELSTVLKKIQEEVKKPSLFILL